MSKPIKAVSSFPRLSRSAPFAVISLILFVIVLSLPLASSAATYYVATNGLDSNPGTLSSPFATLNKGVGILKPGDTLYIRGGNYNQAAYMTPSGTSTARITISSYPGERAVIDGQYTKPTGTWTAMFTIEGSYVTIKDLTIQQGNWGGLVLKGKAAYALRVTSQRNMENGILVTGLGDDTTVEDCDVYYNCKSNEYLQTTRGSWATGISSARGPKNVLIKGNRVWNNWGEGISSYETSYTRIEGNTIYDNKLNVYLSDTTFCTVKGNLIYCTPGNPCYNVSQIGIGLGDEVYQPPSANNTIIDNLLLNNAKNIYYWPGVNSTGALVNVTIAYNTAVNSAVETNLKLGAGSHANSVIKNNIFIQEGTLPAAVVVTPAGITFGRNLWSKTPPSAASGAGDKIADARLKRLGSTAAGLLAPSWFKLSTNSPAINMAEVMTIAPVDYFEAPRGTQPDAGAIELGIEPPGSLRVLDVW